MHAIATHGMRRATRRARSDPTAPARQHPRAYFDMNPGMWQHLTIAKIERAGGPSPGPRRAFRARAPPEPRHLPPRDHLCRAHARGTRPAAGATPQAGEGLDSGRARPPRGLRRHRNDWVLQEMLPSRVQTLHALNEVQLPV
jgi:hypothetical protein